MPKRVVIAGGVLGTEDGPYQADLVIDGERISAITLDASDIEADERINAHGQFVVPGGIDAHTHFRDPDPNYVEGFTYGSTGAIAGGITSVVEMPQASPVSSEAQHIREKAQLGEQQSIIDFALWGAAINQDIATIQEMVDEGVVGIKSFMTGSSASFPMITDDSMRDVFELLAEQDVPYGIHAENDALVETGMARLKAAGRTDARAHAESRPPIVEAEAVNRALFFAEQTGGYAYICHSSTVGALELVDRARLRGVRVAIETCPQYLALDEDDLARLGPFGRCAPAIRTRDEVEDLWEYVIDGTMDVISSDHCGYTIESKKAGLANIWDAPLGLSGVQTMLPTMFDEMMHRRSIGLDTFVALTSTNPARIFSLYPRKGVIQVGSDADLAFYDPDQTWVATGADMLHRNKWTPFEGKEIRGRVVRTMVRGQTVYTYDEGHQVHGEAGYGKFLSRGYGLQE